jgi:DNA-binding GntR family transcriptional regulator
LCAPSNNERLKKMIEEYCLSTTNRYPHLRMSLDTQKEDVQRDHYQIVDACKRRAVDEVVTLLEQHILETKREVLAAARLA